MSCINELPFYSDSILSGDAERHGRTMAPDDPSDERADRTEATGLAAEGVLTDLYGSHPRTKILVALLTQDWHDLPVRKIAELANLDQSTVYRHLEPLVELGVVVQEREIGGARCYRIDRDSELAKLVKRTEEAVLDRQSEGGESSRADSMGSV